jgi:hypothetical protein
VRWAPLLVAGLLATPVGAADLKAVDRNIRKQPAYQTKSPRYGLLVFGPEAKDRVWLVHDGDTLYVDRNGDGDLTDPGEAVAAKREPGRDPDESGDYFDVGELRVGGRAHKGLLVLAHPLARHTDEVKNQPNAKAALAADPKARVYRLYVNVDRPGFHGAGTDGRIVVQAGSMDGEGALLFADKPAGAPIMHLDGPLQVTTDSAPPALKLERDTDLLLVVGTPGLGTGTFVKLAYDQTIPDTAVPRVEVLFPPAKGGDPPVRELYELSKRC